MFWVLLTVICYSISSLGDKYISVNLKCTTGEFSFIVSIATAFWITLLLPFTGWQFENTLANGIILLSLAGWKVLEFYTSALLLKSVSAYELKAWLGLNIIFSYLSNLIRGQDTVNLEVFISCIPLLWGIYWIIKSRYKKEDKRSIKKMIILSLFYIAAKFGYGLMLGMMSKGCKTISVLWIVMVIVALTQLPRVKLKEIMKKKGLFNAYVTRIPNAAGLLTEAMAAMENVFLYAMIQPVQLAILFIIALLKREELGKIKIAGSMLSILAVVLITVFLKL